jgi:ribosomal protein S18 acetylase RimI-like enzyme
VPRPATDLDALTTAARLLCDFNEEYGDPAPPVPVLVERLVALTASGDTRVVLADEDAGVALLRFRPGLWSAGQECYLAELYVVPGRRGQGLGRALLSSALEVARAAGAVRIELGTSEDDVAARKLYETLGFTRFEGPGGPLMFVYEREL